MKKIGLLLLCLQAVGQSAFAVTGTIDTCWNFTANKAENCCCNGNSCSATYTSEPSASSCNMAIGQPGVTRGRNKPISAVPKLNVGISAKNLSNPALKK
mgnify:CR=1 FL=1